MKFSEFAVIVVGGGHAGIEAAHAAAKLGVKTLLITQNLDHIGNLSCNPAIGGIGKGHMVREIDALGGLMGLLADHSAIQFRMLNSRKGPAVRGPRAQIDKKVYRNDSQRLLDQTPNLTLFQGEVKGLLLNHDQIFGVTTTFDLEFHAKSVVLTTGTFLNGKAHIGAFTYPSGRLGDNPSILLSHFLAAMGLTIRRFKTGTPPRLDKKTIRWEATVIQMGDEKPQPFSYETKEIFCQQVPCHITQTNEKTLDIIKANISSAPLFNGQIEGVGPRYCPSIEDKINKFPNRVNHTLFLEPEGIHSNEIYPNGISTSLPFEIQMKIVNSIKGLEHARITRPGYAIEYDVIDPTQLNHHLEYKGLPGLFFAGQINGTTGYEEAAGQGLIAGINAARSALSMEKISMNRKTSYLGVMVDDLVTKGVDEPYRMFTSRAELRIFLRADNADIRLTPFGHEVGLIREPRWLAFLEKRKILDETRLKLSKTRIQHEGKSKSILEIFRMNTEFPIELFNQCGMGDLDENIKNTIIHDCHYEGYLHKFAKESDDKNYGNIRIPVAMNWHDVQGISTEIREKLARLQPKNVEALANISGMTSSAIYNIIVFLNKA